MSISLPKIFKRFIKKGKPVTGAALEQFKQEEKPKKQLITGYVILHRYKYRVGDKWSEFSRWGKYIVDAKFYTNKPAAEHALMQLASYNHGPSWLVEFKIFEFKYYS